MTRKTNSFEGGTAGTLITTANSGGTSGTAIQLVGSNFAYTSGGAHGSLSATPGASGNQLLWTLATGTCTSRLYFKVPANPTAAAIVAIAFTGSTTFSYRLVVNTTGKLSLQNAASSNVWNGTIALTAGQWYRVEIVAVAGTTTTNGTLKLDYYAADSTTPVEAGFSSTTANTGTIAHTNWQVGWLSGSWSTAPAFDDLAMDDTVTSYIGPVPTNAAPTANAGADQTGIEPGTTATLDGSGSSDSDGTVAAYSWRLVSKTSGAPSPYQMSALNIQKPTFLMPPTSAGVTYVFGLTVTDNSGAASTEDTVSIGGLAAGEFLNVGGVNVPAYVRVV